MNFNETELAIFKLQAEFELGGYYESQDGTICAIDEENHKIFIGQDLLRVNVHNLDSLQSVSLADGGIMEICLGEPKKTLCLKFHPEDAEALFEKLNAFVPTGKAQVPHKEEAASQTENPATRVADATPHVAEESQNYYEARQSMDELHNILFPKDLPSGILDVARTLKFGDRIHVEYKQIFGRTRGRFAVFSQFFCRWSSRSMSIFAKGGDFEELKENLLKELSDKISINFACDGDVSETNCKLSRITALRKLE